MTYKNSPLYRKLLSIRSDISDEAQKVVDSWEQDEEGYDQDFGYGGVCDAVSEAIASMVSSKIDNVDITDGGQDGDDHAFIIVYDEVEAFAVDIPPNVYETGGGYSWKKRADASISPNDVIVYPVDRNLIIE